MTRSEVTAYPKAESIAADQRASGRDSQSPGHSDLWNGKTSPLINPPIFRRFWSTGVLEQGDLQLLQSQAWTRGTVEAKARIDTGSGFCILASGLAVRYRTSDGGKKQSIALILPGDICDYSLITSTAPRTQPVALTKSSVLRIAPERAIELCEKSTNVMAAILAQLAVDQLISEELLFSIARRTALERTAHLLCELEYRFRRMGLSASGRFPLSLTQIELGHHLGLTPVHVNRTMQELRRRQLIRTHGAGVELPDLKELQRLAEFSPDYLTVAATKSGPHFDA